MSGGRGVCGGGASRSVLLAPLAVIILIQFAREVSSASGDVVRLKRFVYITASVLHRTSIKDKSIRQSISSEFNRVSDSSRAPSLPPQLAHGALPTTTTHPARKTNKKSCPQNGRRLPPNTRSTPAPLRDCIPAALINMAVFLPPLLIARIPPGLPPRPRRRRLNR